MRIVFACFSAREVSWASGPAEDLIISLVVTPAKAGGHAGPEGIGIPAFAGMTSVGSFSGEAADEP